MTWSRDLRIAFRPPEDIRIRQEALLREHIRYCMDRSPFYRRQLRGLRVPRTASLEDLLSDLPLTGKEELETHNEDFFAVPWSKVSDLVTSSGTTGRPTRIPYTERDLRRLAYNEEKAFIGCGLTREDIVLLTCTLDRCFIAGLAYFLGARNLGATSIRNGHDTPDGYAGIIRSIRPTALVGVPSFVRKLGYYLKEKGMDPAALSVRRIVAIGESVRNREMSLLESGRDMEATWGARLFSTYASSETATSFCECTAQQGGHLHPDLAVVEILDARGAPVPDGESGEVVVTPLGVEGMPLLRFRTGDISFLLSGPCACGRNAPRLGPILGRRAQMLKVRGTTLYPPALLTALAEMDGISDFYVAAESDDALSDRVVVHAALCPGAVLAADAIALRLRSVSRVKPEVRIEPEEAVRRVIHNPASRKPVRFVDRRPSSGHAC